MEKDFNDFIEEAKHHRKQRNEFLASFGKQLTENMRLLNELKSQLK